MRVRSAVAVLTATVLLSLGAGVLPADAAPPPGQPGEANRQEMQKKYDEKIAKAQEKRDRRVTQPKRDEAAARALQDGAINPLMTGVTAAAAAVPGDAPHYFSHPNYANSPLPTITTAPGASTYTGNPLQDRTYGTDSATDVFGLLPTDLPVGMLSGIQVQNQANADPALASAGKKFNAYVLRPTGTADQYTVVFDSGELTMPGLADPAVSETTTFTVANLPVQAGDRLAWYGQGIPLDIGGGADYVYFPAPTKPLQDSTITVGTGDFPLYSQDRTYSIGADVTGPDSTEISGGMRKFVDPLQDIQTAVPDTTTYPGADYYEIGLVEYTHQFHADLPPTKVRGYVQLNGPGGAQEPSHLGPAIPATKDRPVRILFRNQLPTGTGGDLFLPVDSTVMGSGMTPDGHAAMEADPGMVDPANPMCTASNQATKDAKDAMVPGGHCYSENRAAVHLHGGITPWISDGTPHQWITPAGEDTPLPTGVSVENVPDMPDPGPGAQTFFYTNAQSARLMFYHDHAWGITRLNVYAGEAAPYIITDDTEKKLVADGVLPAAEDTKALVFQDKTFVPGPEQLAQQDETWDTTLWGALGSLWLPH